MKKYLVIVMIVLAVVLSGCSANESYDPSYEQEYEDNYNDENTDQGQSNPDPVVETPTDQGGTPDTNQDAPALENRKIIYKANLEMAVLEPNSVYESILDEISNYTAYIEEADITTNYYNFTVRVLSSEFDDFVEAVKTNGELVSFSKTSEDVTNSYSTYEARVAALETRHERILELISDAVDLDTILMLEEERYEIESSLNSLGNVLSNYDSLVDYSTVTIKIRKAVEEIVVLPRTEAPRLQVIDKTNNTLTFQITNNSDENVTIHVDLFLNGEFVEEYVEDTYSDSIVEVTFDELKSNKEYTVKVTASAAEHRLSLIEIMKTTTEKTYGNRVTNTFVGSVDLVVDIFEFIGLAISGVLPFAVVGAVIFVPVRIFLKKKDFKWKATEKPVDKEE